MTNQGCIRILAFGEVLEISQLGATQSELLADFEPREEPFPIDIGNVTIDALKFTLKFCEEAARNPDHSDFTQTDSIIRLRVAHIAAWQTEMIEQYAHSTHELSNILRCADFMHVSELISLCARCIACRFTMKSLKDMLKMLGLPDDVPADPEDAYAKALALHETAREIHYRGAMP